MATPRAIRIPRPNAGPTRATLPPSDPASRAIPEVKAVGKVDRRHNQAASERAFRLAMIYLGALAVLYVAFVLLDRSSPGGTSATAEEGLLYFTAIAAALGVGGALVALSPAPRALEVHSDSLVVIEWWGRRRTFPSLDELRVSVVRRYRPGFLSSRPVEAVEIGEVGGVRRTYQLEEGLIAEHRPERRSLRV